MMVLLTEEEEVMYKQLKRAGPYPQGSGLQRTFDIHNRMAQTLAFMIPAVLIVGMQMWGTFHRPSWFGVSVSIVSCMLVGAASYNAAKMFRSMFRLRAIVVSTIVKICKPNGPLTFQQSIQEFQVRVDSKPKQV